MVFRSPAFEDYKPMPAEHTADGKNVNPPFRLAEIPEGVKSFTLICHDPDATSGGDWVHWLVWNIDPRTKIIEKGDELHGAIEGTTSFGEPGYGGPAPMPGTGPHRYIFSLYALDIRLNIPLSSTREDVQKIMAGHTLAQSTWTGTYER